MKKGNSGLNAIRTHDLCETGAELYQLSYQASDQMRPTINVDNGGLATLWVRNIYVDGEESLSLLMQFTLQHEEKPSNIIGPLQDPVTCYKLRGGLSKQGKAGLDC